MSKSSQAYVCLFLVSVFSSLSYAVTPDRIAGALSSSNTLSLQGHVHPMAEPKYDQGPVDPAMRLVSVRLLTVPTVSQQRGLTSLIGQQQDRKSTNYHRWLTPEQYGAQFGLSQNDAGKIVSWLKSQGFTSINVARARNWISFDGTAAQVQSAFGTEIHRFTINGESHYANTRSPSIPAGLAGVVTGIRGLHDFRPRPMGIRRAQPYYNSANFGDLIAPGDIATMYGITSLYGSGIDGTGQKLVVAGQTDIFIEDINDFRSGFGLSSITGCTKNATSGVVTACNASNFQYVLLGADPLQASSGDLSEADLDIEWAGAIARNAQIIYVNGQTGGGAFDAYYDAIDNARAPVISLSYGLCELQDQPFVASDEAELALGNAEGITIVNSSGDSGAAQCDYSAFLAVKGLSVNYPGSSPAVTSVGGTAVPLANFTSTYWGTINGTDGGTVLSYIPEQGWNDDDEIAQYCQQHSTNSFCINNGITNAQTAQAAIGISSTGGGPSNCSTVNGSGVCTGGFARPVWQTVTVSGQSGVRLTPDISLLASPNFPGYIFCTQLSELGITGAGSSCASGISNSVENDASIIGGTSASAPVFAGIVTLLNQYLAGPSSPGLGNINPTLYSLAATPANGVYNPVTTDNNLVYCSPGTPSNQPVALRCPGIGVFGYQASTADATTGYNLVAGLGSVNVDALASAWAATRSSTSITISPSTTQINQGQNVTFTATLSSTTALGNVSFYNNSSTTALGMVALTNGGNGIAVFSTTALPVGTDNVTAAYNGDGFNNPSTTATAATVTVIAPDFTLGAAPTSGSVVAGHATSASTVTVTPVNGFNQTTTFSCTGLPTGATCAFNPQTVTPDGTNPATSSLTISTAASMAAGTTTITVNASGAGVSHTSSYALTVTTPTDQSFTLAPAAQTYSTTQGQSVDATINLTATNGFNTPVTYTCSDPASESTCTGPTAPTSATSVTFHLGTRAPSAAQLNPRGRGLGIFYASAIPALLGILFTAGSRKRSQHGMRLIGLIVALGFSTLWLSSCGGSSGGTKDPGTPKGAYTITVNATTGGANPVTGSTTFTLQVN